eukprot:TRINITY_DN5575_c0_g1_i1.p1 TRINITY_DN5575_c0_g1~~TRINITY_DN5575_c0_g1_i1.p1  ORF type:complete len:224 (-),score=56.91 TRINITY_DN5575_c0_g1_i1:185-856(-)
MSEYKITVLGAGGVGKSALVVQFVHNKFVEKYDPTIEDSYRKTIDVDGQACQLDILDTAGQEEYTNIQEEYIRNGQGFIIVYSVTSPSSFDDAKEIRKKMAQFRDAKASDTIPTVLVGNKVDLEDERGVEKEEGDELAKTFGCAFFETSAKDRLNVDEVFLDIVRQINKTGFDPKAAEQAEAEAARKKAEAAAHDSATAEKPATAASVPAPKPIKKKSRCVLL